MQYEMGTCTECRDRTCHEDGVCIRCKGKNFSVNHEENFRSNLIYRIDALNEQTFPSHDWQFTLGYRRGLHDVLEQIKELLLKEREALHAR